MYLRCSNVCSIAQRSCMPSCFFDIDSEHDGMAVFYGLCFVLKVSAISGAIRNDMKPGYVGMLPGECMQQQQAWAPAGTPTDQVPQPHSVMSSHPSSNQPITQQMSEIAQSPVTSHNADSVNSADRMYMTSKSFYCCTSTIVGTMFR